MEGLPIITALPQLYVSGSGILVNSLSLSSYFRGPFAEYFMVVYAVCVCLFNTMAVSHVHHLVHKRREGDWCLRRAFVEFVKEIDNESCMREKETRLAHGLPWGIHVR